jgi:hypothetical protein
VRPLSYLLQVFGLVVTLGSLIFFGFKPHMGPMLYTALAGAGIFYTGVVLAKRCD